jgi:hypothetical protein
MENEYMHAIKKISISYISTEKKQGVYELQEASTFSRFKA